MIPPRDSSMASMAFFASKRILSWVIITALGSPVVQEINPRVRVRTRAKTRNRLWFRRCRYTHTRGLVLGLPSDPVRDWG